MKKSFLALALVALGLTQSAHAVVLVTGFGTGQFTNDFSSFTSNVQTATTFQITGNDFGSTLFGSLPAPISIVGNNFQLSLTGTFTGTAASNFQIDLFDTNGNDRLYQANFASFTQNVPTTVNMTFVAQTGAFDNSVVSLQFLTNGTGSTINLTMDTLTASAAVPEPSTWALLGFGVMGVIVLRRTKFKA